MIKDKNLTFGNTHITKSGREIPVEIKTHYVEIDGKICIFVLSRDISERKRAEKALRESEERFRSLFNNALDAIFLQEIIDSDSNTRFVEVNDVACERLEYSREEFMHLSLHDIALARQEKLQEIWDHLYADGSFIFEDFHVSKSGRKIPKDWN